MTKTGIAALRHHAIFGALALLTAVLVSTPETRAEEQGARAFLEALSERAVVKLTDPSAGDGEKEDRFRDLMAEGFDLPLIGKFVLGANWKSATPEQQKEFADVFETALVQRFLPMFKDHADESLELTGVRRDQGNPKLIFIDSKISRPEGEPYAVEWRIRARSNDYKILDVSAEGVSMILTLRQEYDEVVEDSGVDGLIAALRSMTGSGGS